MFRLSICLLMSFAVLAVQAQAAKTVDLRCEYETNPLGVDTRRPYLSWRMESATPGQKQAAYQILVAGSPDKLKERSADLWDSGKVKSDRSQHVPYSGKPLSSGMECYWAVRVWPVDGEAGDWSEPGLWTMALDERDPASSQNSPTASWIAQWISYLLAADKAELAHERSVDARGNRVIRIKVPQTAPVEKGMVVIKAELEGKPDLDPVKHFYDAQKKQLVLEAKDFHAYTAPKTLIYYDRDMDAIHNFFAKGGDAPVWTFDVAEAGEYSVSILYAAHPNLAKDKKNDIQIDGKTRLSFATRATKGSAADPWRNFSAHEIGRISMETGRRTLAIVPQPNQDGRNLTIKHILLTKVE